MIRSRNCTPAALAVVIKPPFGVRAKVSMAASIWPASRMLIGVTSNPCEGATACMTANKLVAKAWLASRRIAIRVKRGAICFSSSTHLPAMLNSQAMNPVTLPPGRAKLSTTPAPTGSTPRVNTMGMTRVACSKGDRVEFPPARMTSGARAANSAACLRSSAASELAQRVSMFMLRPIVQPKTARA